MDPTFKREDNLNGRACLTEVEKAWLPPVTLYLNLEFRASPGDESQQWRYVATEAECYSENGNSTDDIEPSVSTPKHTEARPNVCKRFKPAEEGVIRLQVSCRTLFL